MLNKKALAASVSAPPAEYVEDVFSTYLYTGNGSTQTITNGIDISGEGGLVWIKKRTGSSVMSNYLTDTARGVSDGYVSSNTANASNPTQVCNAFNNNGFGYDPVVSDTGDLVCSWTFRKAPKFFDVVTYTGNGSNRTISHNLGSVPGMIIVKRTSDVADWQVYHRSLANTEYLVLNTTDAKNTGTTRWNSTTPTSTEFSVGTNSTVNSSGETYVAYLFAHDAGGFGTAGTDNIISCGSYSGSGAAGNTITLGYEPQFLLIKCTTTPSLGNTNWLLIDVMRGMPVSGTSKVLYPNTSGAEASFPEISPTATGFILRNDDEWLNGSGQTYIYMAIRRPMKTPTSGTEVFSPTYVSAVSTGTKSTTGFPIDLQILSYATGTTENQTFVDRLRGVSTNATESGSYLISSSTAAEATSPAETRFWDNTGFQQHSYFSGGAARYWNFRRATGFFDVVCYTGTGSARTVTHNLGAVPELMILKKRSATSDWFVYDAFASLSLAYPFMLLNRTDGRNGANAYNDGVINGTRPTSTVFSLGPSGYEFNDSSVTYVAYLFASVTGVSKVGTYTGNGSSQTINCGFTAGARFVLIKRTDSTGDWYVFDTARGIVSGNDPFLLLNSTAAEVTTRDAVDPDNSGFIVNNDGTNFPINVNAATYIYLAIA